MHRSPSSESLADISGGLRVLVVEDEPTIIEFLRTGLGYEGCTVTIATDGRMGLRLVSEDAPDLIVLDLMLPDLDGFEVCRRLRAMGVEIPIIMLTARQDISDRVTGLDLGADDYLTKPFSFDELLARIRAVLRRRGIEPAATILRNGELTLNPETHEAHWDKRQLDLTPTEFALLGLLMRHPRRVFTRETLLNRVWGFDFVGDPNVVDVHVSHLRQKIGAVGRRRIRTVYGVGYSFRPDDDDVVE